MASARSNGRGEVAIAVDRLSRQRKKRKPNAETQRTLRKLREEGKVPSSENLLRHSGLLGDSTGAEGFFASMAQAEQADGYDEKQARFDEELTAIKPGHRPIF